MTITFNPKFPQIGLFTAGLSVDAFKLTLKQINNIVACICTPSIAAYTLCFVFRVVMIMQFSNFKDWPKMCES